MATTTFGVNDPLAVKLWSRRLDVEALKQTFFASYIGTTASSLAQEMTEPKKGPGDQVTWGLRMLAHGDGVSEGQVLEGNEESLTMYSDAMVINELRHGIRVKNKQTIDAQRVPYDLREEAYETLKDWWADRLDTAFFNTLAGNTAQTNDKYYGFNAPLAPSANRVIRPGGKTTDQTLVAADIFTLNLIDKCVNIAKTASPMLRPIKGLARDVDYVIFVHPDQVLSLRSDTATVGNWFDLQKARLMGGEKDGSALYTGAVGIYNRTLIVEATRLPKGVNSTNATPVDLTRRAVFCGAQAMSVAFGQAGSMTKFSWSEKLFDYEDELGVKAGLVFGMKKDRYDNEDFGTITVPTYAAPAV